MKPHLTFFFIQVTAFIFASQSLSAVIINESKVDSLYSIVFNNDISYSKKIKTVRSFSSMSLYTEYYDKMNPLFERLLGEARQNSDNNGMLFCYNSLINMHIGLPDKGLINKYIDSAEVYLNKSKDVQLIASYYGNRGRFIHRYYPDRTLEAISDYQNSLYFFDKAGMKGYEDVVVIILRNLVIDGIQRNDSVYVSKNVNKIIDLKKSYNSPVVEYLSADVNRAISEMYYTNTRKEMYLDSIINHTRICLNLYESGLSPDFLSYIAVDLYSMMAEAMGRKKDVNIAVVDSLLSIAESKSELTDSIGIARIYQVKAFTFFNQNMIDSAEMYIMKSQKYLEGRHRNNYYSQVKININLIRDIYIAKGDYKKSIEYDDLWMKKDEEIRANEVKELELQFEVESKGLELKQLNSNIIYQDNLHKMYILVCVLLCLAILFLMLLTRSKKKYLNSRLALIDAEREETKLKLMLKDEQAVKSQLEKYEVLSDFHLKEMELIGKTKELEQLYLDKENLDKQVELFHQKIEEYESSEKGEQTNNDIQNVIIEDLKRLISRQMPEKILFIDNINSLSNLYIDTISENSDGKLSVSYLKYCVCFAIGMTISDVAECFNIEQSSVHMIRYRLKKKFGLGNDDDLDVFLRNHGRLKFNSETNG